MKKVNKHVLKVVEHLTKGTVNVWPPFCSGIYHQPRRPVDKKKK